MISRSLLKWLKAAWSDLKKKVNILYKLKSHYLSRNYTLQNHSFLKNRNNRRKIQINFVGLHPPPKENTHTKRMRQESASKININHLVSSPIAGLTHSKSFTHTMCTQCVQTSKIFFVFQNCTWLLKAYLII